MRRLDDEARCAAAYVYAVAAHFKKKDRKFQATLQRAAAEADAALSASLATWGGLAAAHCDLRAGGAAAAEIRASAIACANAARSSPPG